MGRIRIYLLASRNLSWDIPRLDIPSSYRSALGLYMSFSRYDEDAARTSHLTHCCVYRSSLRYALHHGRRQYINKAVEMIPQSMIFKFMLNKIYIFHFIVISGNFLGIFEGSHGNHRAYVFAHFDPGR